MDISESLLSVIGKTPLVRLKSGGDTDAQVLVKLESRNPAGSVKDRLARALVEDGEKRGLLGPGSVIIEPTSGNTGIGLAMLSAIRGYRCILLMPASMSKERMKLLEFLGAELVLTPSEEGMKGALARAESLCAETGHSFMPRQFDNPANPAIHETTTGPEIWEATAGTVDIFVAGIGTGGTITGTGRYLKSRKSAIRVIGVEPAESPVISRGVPGSHRIQGIGAGFVPAILDRSVLDEVMTVTSDAAFAMARSLARTDGLLAGISSGAAIHVALELAARPENARKKIVVIAPDSAERYISTTLFEG